MLQIRISQTLQKNIRKEKLCFVKKNQIIEELKLKK